MTRMSTNAYQTLFDRSADAILILEEGRFVDCNDAAVKMLRAKSKEEVLMTHPSELSPERQPDGRASFEKANEMIEIAIQEGSHRFEWEHIRVDGEVFPVEVLLTPIDGVLHTVWRDISDRKELEKQMRHSQKMEAVGKLAGGVAHDFNNLLVVILGNCDLFEMSDSIEEQQESLGQIRKAGQKATRLVRQLLTFSRSQEVTRQCLDLGLVVVNLEDMLARLLGEDVSLSVQADAQCTIFANLNQVEQVVINLATNARDALLKGGNIKISARSVPGTEEMSQWVVLEVHDDGEGMREDIRARIFEPFFTTKPTGQGTGLGLAMVYGVVESAGGQTEVHSELGVGTTMILRFPFAGNLIPVPLEREEKALIHDDKNAECILLVEDDLSVAQVTQQLLTAAGFVVRTAPQGEMALKILEADVENDIRLVISDVVMPRLGGPELIQAMRARGDERPVLLISGYTASALQGLKELEETFAVVEKPFVASALIAEVRALLDVP